RADAADPDQFLPFGLSGIALAFRRTGGLRHLLQCVEGEEVAREALGVGFADMAYAEPEKEARERHLAPLLDRGEELLHRYRAEAVDLFQLLQRAFQRCRQFLLPAAQGEDIGRRL